jgi:predicted RNA binding protein YcfA (HicA-like mRNA interferase family)
VKLPRDLSGTDLARALAKAGYRITRQTGSHIRLTADSPTRHHVTVPAHDPLKVGTLSGILSGVATHLKIERDELLRQIGYKL